MFERHHEPVIAHHLFLRRLATSAGIALLVLLISLAIGMLGYHFIVGLGWVEAFENAAMILSGMGPVDEVPNRAGKVFAGCYALFSGVVFLTTAAIFFAPLLHRLLHLFHRHPPQRSDPSADSPSRDKPQR
jgi:hypothetical protein